MKNWIFSGVLALFAMWVVTPLNAQEKLTKGMITYEISDISGDMEEAELEQARSMMGSTTMDLYFTPDKSLLSVNIMGGMMSTRSLYKGETVTMYMDMMGQKIMIETSQDEMSKMGEQEITADDFEMQTMKDDTKVIEGYKCHKVVMMPKDNAETAFGNKLTMYVTDLIEANNDVIQNVDFGEFFKHFPLEYMMEVENMKITYTATKVSGDVPKDAFEIDGKGYKVMTMEEFMESMGGMMR